MAQWRRSKERGWRKLFICTVVCAMLLFSVLSILSISSIKENAAVFDGKYLYWGSRVDCPGKNCLECGGLGHQESSLRCALEEALFLKRTFVLPSRMCVVGKHNDKSLLGPSPSAGNWDEGSCAITSLYDLNLISQRIRVITDDSEEWRSAYERALQTGAIVTVKGISRQQLLREPVFSKAMVINRTASTLAWFVECKDRKNHSTVLLPYEFLPSAAAKPLREAAEQIRALLRDYDAMHVRRGDVLNTRKDRFGVLRTKFPHLDRDTQPGAIMEKVSSWVPTGRTLYIASNEKRPDFFDPLGSRYRLARSSNFSAILKPLIHNNYQLFMVDRLVLAGAKTLIQTFKEKPGDLSLTEDVKKVMKWEKPVSTFED